MPINEEQLSMAMEMKVQDIAGFIGWDQGKIDAFIKDVNEL